MVIYPIVRLSSRRHIESLQNGKLFLRNNTYYQRIEESDQARNDVFDGSIPFPDDGTLSAITGNEVKNARIMKFTAYVACFYHFHCEKYGCFYVPEEDKEALLAFNCDTALIIDPVEFENRVRSACERENLPLMIRDVFYISPNQEKEIIEHIRSGFVPMFIQTPQFVKSNRFYEQHEYRVSIDYTPDFLASHINGQVLSLNYEAAKKLNESTLTIDIGPIADISEIVTVEELLNSYFKAE